jgi:hypothetical protein
VTTTVPASAAPHVHGTLKAALLPFGYQGSVQGAPAPEQGSVHLTHKHHDIVTGCHGKPSISLSLLGQIQYLLVDELERIHFSRSFMLRTFK